VRLSQNLSFGTAPGELFSKPKLNAKSVGNKEEMIIMLIEAAPVRRGRKNLYDYGGIFDDKNHRKNIFRQLFCPMPRLKGETPPVAAAAAIIYCLNFCPVMLWDCRGRVLPKIIAGMRRNCNCRRREAYSAQTPKKPLHIYREPKQLEIWNLYFGDFSVCSLKLIYSFAVFTSRAASGAVCFRRNA